MSHSEGPRKSAFGNKPLRVAVVGVGYLGRFHAQKYQQINMVDFVGVCDQNAERVQKIATELSVAHFQDYRDLLGRVDAVTIASTTLSHYSIARFFLENGVHVHVEKPMTSTVPEAEELVALAKRNKLKLQVGHVERFNSALLAARENLLKPLFIECHRLAPFKPRGVDVNVVLDLMIHDLDVILSMVPSEVVSVSAVGTPVLTKTVDIANARIEFASGTVANVTASRVSRNSVRKFRVFQNNQYLSIDFGSGEVNLLTKTGEIENWENDNIPLEAQSWNLGKTDALLGETQSFVQSIVEDHRPVVSGEDGLVALKLAEQIIVDIQRRLPQ